MFASLILQQALLSLQTPNNKLNLKLISLSCKTRISIASLFSRTSPDIELENNIVGIEQNGPNSSSVQRGTEGGGGLWQPRDLYMQVGIQSEYNLKDNYERCDSGRGGRVGDTIKKFHTVSPLSSIPPHSTIPPHSVVSPHSVVLPQCTVAPHTTISSHSTVSPHSKHHYTLQYRHTLSTITLYNITTL